MVTIIFKNKDRTVSSEKFFNKVQRLCGFPKTDMVYYDGKNDISMKIGRKVPVNLGKYLRDMQTNESIEWYLTIPHEENMRRVSEGILEFAGKVNLDRFTVKYEQWYVIGNVDDGVSVLTDKIKQVGINRQVYRRVYNQDMISVIESIILLVDDWKTSVTKKEQMLASIGRITMLMWSKQLIKERSDEGVYAVTKDKDVIRIEAKYSKKENVHVKIELDRGVMIRKIGDVSQKMETFK